jgi:hypothetical protein
VQETPLNSWTEDPGGLGLELIDQAVPFHRSINFFVPLWL